MFLVVIMYRTKELPAGNNSPGSPDTDTVRVGKIPDIVKQRMKVIRSKGNEQEFMLLYNNIEYYIGEEI